MKTPSVQTIAEKLLQAMKENHFSNSMLRNARYITAKITRLHEIEGCETINLEILERFKDMQMKRFGSGEFGSSTLSNYLCVAKRMATLFLEDNIVVKRPLLGNELTDYYKNILLEVRATKFGAKSIQPQIVSRAYQYFKWLLENDYQNLLSVTHEALRQYMLSLSERLNGNSLCNAQRFLKHLNRNFLVRGYITDGFEKILSMPIAIEKKVLPAMDICELSQVLSCIDKETAIGKRRYAIMLLGVVIGLRAGDIANLKFSEIDWRTGTIQIVQSKTKKPLVLPLTSDVGNALVDYILNGRPKVKSEKIFLNAVAPYNDIRSGTVITTVSKCKIVAGLSPYGGFHSLRRAMGKNMSIAGIPVTTIAQILGHIGLSSTHQYISLDSVHLKSCALGFSGIEPQKLCLQRRKAESCALDFTNIRPLKEVCLS